MDARCEALTQAGKQCSRRASEGGVCVQHMAIRHSVISVREVEPWTLRSMPTPSDKLRAHVLQKLRRKLKAGPRPNTPRGRHKGGSIYVYCLVDDEQGPHLYKVGQTTDAVERRLASWARKHSGREIKCCAIYVVNQDVAWVERVVHLYLDYCRVYRYPLVASGQLESVWAATGEPLDGKQPASPRSRLVSEKMIEWFAAPLEDIDAIIAQVH